MGARLVTTPYEADKASSIPVSPSSDSRKYQHAETKNTHATATTAAAPHSHNQAIPSECPMHQAKSEKKQAASATQPPQPPPGCPISHEKNDIDPRNMVQHISKMTSWERTFSTQSVIKVILNNNKKQPKTDASTESASVTKSAVSVVDGSSQVDHTQGRHREWQVGLSVWANVLECHVTQR